MPLSDIFGIASTALNAQRVRMNLTASNLANAGTTAATEDLAYRGKRTVFKALMDDSMTHPGAEYVGGVKVDKIVDDTKDRKSTRLNSSHSQQSRMPSSA